MGRDAMKARGNPWYEVRIKAAKWDDRLASREGAAAELKMSVDAVKDGWIDRTEDGLFLHDWDVWQEQWYKALNRREKDNERKRDDREARKALKKLAEQQAGKENDHQIGLEGDILPEVPADVPADIPVDNPPETPPRTP